MRVLAEIKHLRGARIPCRHHGGWLREGEKPCLERLKILLGADRTGRAEYVCGKATSSQFLSESLLPGYAPVLVGNRRHETVRPVRAERDEMARPQMADEFVVVAGKLDMRPALGENRPRIADEGHGHAGGAHLPCRLVRPGFAGDDAVDAVGHFRQEVLGRKFVRHLKQSRVPMRVAAREVEYAGEDVPPRSAGHPQHDRHSPDTAHRQQAYQIGCLIVNFSVAIEFIRIH